MYALSRLPNKTHSYNDDVINHTNNVTSRTQFKVVKRNIEIDYNNNNSLKKKKLLKIIHTKIFKCKIAERKKSAERCFDNIRPHTYAYACIYILSVQSQYLQTEIDRHREELLFIQSLYAQLYTIKYIIADYHMYIISHRTYADTAQFIFASIDHTDENFCGKLSEIFWFSVGGSCLFYSFVFFFNFRLFACRPRNMCMRLFHVYGWVSAFCMRAQHLFTWIRSRAY